ncbi:MAG: hypothetical protein KIT83_11145 [Bryobacterales bacterium]|nr:hypothetical protein [Bryobacterales bacterium]
MKAPSIAKRPLVIAASTALLALLALPGASFLYEMGGGESCARCHEIAPNHDTWRVSTHKDVPCTACHGDALTLDADFHLGNLRRIAVHFFGELPERIQLRTKDVAAITQRCESCHAQEFRQWTSGGHSVDYASIFLRPGHNHSRQLMDDCLRCHGMHQPGDIASVVTPVSMEGPWTLVNALPTEHSIPCLSCHAMHVDATEAKAGYLRQTSVDVEPFDAGKEIKLRPSLGFYDRRSEDHVSARFLPVPAIQQGTRPVAVAATPQNALCYQCHAPYANLQAGTNDDKTPLGRYEGMACLDCHEKHTLKSSFSCAEFHRDPDACLDRIPALASSVE